MSTQTTQITPQAALNEYAALSEYYRQRNLVLAQQLQDMTATAEKAEAALQQMQREVAALTDPTDETEAE